MTKEEEAINSLEKLINIRKNKAGQIKYDNCICSTTDLETVLNMLKEKDAEIEKNDKIIDLYIDELVTNMFDRCCQECCRECEKDKDTLRNCTKQYFERRLENE